MSARPLLDDSPQPAIQRLGKYEILGVLGQGAMGVVYNAIDPLIHRRVAVKAIRAPLLGPAAHDLAATQRFRTEARAAGRLTHPNIVSVYEYGESGDERFIAMEYVHGVSLLELTAQGRRLPLDDVTSVLVQLLDALECAHDQGVWHRDIKPANLLVTPDGRLKVTDFGIARIDSSDLTQASAVLGSPGYMAPERYTNEPPDCRVDIFSCGVLLYELLTGWQPFRGDISQVMYQVLHNSPPPPSTLAIEQAPPPRFDTVVARALARRPEDRYANAAEMRAALREAAGRPVPPNVSVATMTRPRPAQDDPPTELFVRNSPSAPAMPPAPQVVMPSAAPIAPAAPVTASTQAHDPAWLTQIGALLVPQLGPIAPLVVRDAARRTRSAHDLLSCVANEALQPGEREPFLARARALLPAGRAAEATRPPAASSLPVLGTTPMYPGLADQAQRVLIQHIGPIASVLVRRALASTTSKEQFFATLVEQAGPVIDGKALLAQLWRIP